MFGRTKGIDTQMEAMVIVPQLNNKTMIKASNAFKIKNALGEAFGHDLKRINEDFVVPSGKQVAQDVLKLSAVVPKISTEQYLAIAKVVEETGCQIECKRSGTSISIHFN